MPGTSTKDLIGAPLLQKTKKKCSSTKRISIIITTQVMVKYWAASLDVHLYRTCSIILREFSFIWLISHPPYLWRYFRQLENGDSNEEPQGIFHFAHSTTLQLFLTTMEIAKDSVPLKASNYESMRNRKWKTSHLAPFAANFAAVFYKYIYLYCFGFYLKNFSCSNRFFFFF